ncbi:hypothetical protein [Marinibacterium profundimaris]|uniref:Uncharacterized protein n=1 Tax=Marinibacterium profundimaris TaxID=1679460 RepID=A0A225NPP1_9RHOB|nr:hypothetical protein [Marinibacterium profundimaris]OWU74751.1 hypothetical protein ATO3_09070 [Marinibacterium profundimaris]
MRKTASAAALALLLAWPLAAPAETSTSNQTALLFGTPHMSRVEEGSTLDYDVHTIRTDATSGDTTETDGHIALRTSAGTEPQSRNVEAELTRDGRSRTLDPFRSVSGNPVLIIFLEQVLQDVSEATGGSSNYLRNRIREGLASGLTEEEVPGGTRLVMQPLAQDPNTAELGPYANLEFSFVIDDALPGMLGQLSAKAGPAEAPVFLEEVTYDAEG